MKTLLQIIDDFRYAADDRGTPPLWSDALLTRYANEAQVEAARRARLIEDRSSSICEIALASGTDVYDIDQRVIRLKRIKLASQAQRLPKIDERDLERARPDWESYAASTPEVWLPWGSRQVRIHPAPSAADTAALWIVREPLLRMRLAEPGLAVTSVTRTGDVARVTLTTAPTVPIVVGDTVTMAGAAQGDYNGAQLVTAVISSTVFEFAVANTPVTPATGTITASIDAVDSELAPRHADHLYHWMMYRALLERDKEEKYDSDGAKRHLDEFEAEFGKRSSAIDETWIARHHEVDDLEGIY